MQRFFWARVAPQTDDQHGFALEYGSCCQSGAPIADHDALMRIAASDHCEATPGADMFFCPIFGRGDVKNIEALYATVYRPASEQKASLTVGSYIVAIR